jgi:pyrroloquinoline-quinone synthase
MGNDRAPRVTACAEDVLRRVKLLDNPYFRALRDGSMTLEHFRESQQQFYFAVRYYPRPMSALLARIPDPAMRLDLLHNLVEEHGDFHAEQFHQNTFRRLLESIGGRIPDVAGVPAGPAVRAFNNVLMGACLSEELGTALACLGIIEYAFAPISSLIGNAVVERGWVKSQDLAHYALHADLDLRHGQELFSLVEPQWDDPARHPHVVQGLELGAYAFDQLYRALHDPVVTGEM